jgi:hypothetical protein
VPPAHPRASPRSDPGGMRCRARASDDRGGRPPSRNDMGTEWTRFPIARLRYTKAAKHWSLYWRDRNLRSTGTTSSRRRRTSTTSSRRSTATPPPPSRDSRQCARRHAVIPSHASAQRMTAADE